MARCFFHSLASFRGRKPPCCVVLFVRCGNGAALHVFSMDSEIFPTMWSRDTHASCHRVGLRWLLFSSRLVSSFICVRFLSKKSMLNISRFSGGIGFNILVVGVVVGIGGLAMSRFCGMCRVTGWWSEFRCMSVFVVEVNLVLFVDFMKKPSIRLVDVKL